MADNTNKKSSWTPQVTEPRSAEMAKLTNPRKVREKQYPADIMGLIQKGIDYLTGNTTYEEAPAQLRQDNRSKFGRELDSQLHDNSTLLGNLYRTWLPVVGAAAAVENPLAVANGMLGGAVGAEVIDKGLKGITGKNWQQLLTPLLGSEAAALTNPGGWIGGVGSESLYKSKIAPATQRAKQVYDVKYSRPSKGAVQRIYPEKYKEDNTIVFYGKGTGKRLPNDPYTEKGGTVVVLPQDSKSTQNMELHFNPTTIHDEANNIVRVIPETVRSMREVKKLMEVLPEGTAMSQSSHARTPIQVIQDSPWVSQLGYILTGKKPTRTKRIVDGYSTDIYPTMQNYASKGLGYMDKSATTKLRSTNMHGKSFEKDNLQRYFGSPDKNGTLYFEDMTPEQVVHWNAEQADKYGLHIDPRTRTAEQSIFVTGSKPNVPLDRISDNLIFDPSGLPYGILGGYISNNSKQ